MIKYLLSSVLILASARTCGGQVQVGGTLNAIPSTIQVTFSPASVGVSGSSVLTATQQMTDGSLGVVRTAQCQWTSASPSVATISPVVGYGPAPTVVGVSAGTSVITCTDGLLSGSATITVAAPPSISNPVCGTPPCVLPQGINGSAYSGFTFAESGCGGTNTWTVTVGSINTGLSLSTAGVISGTPSVSATSVFTVQDSCSSPAGTASVQVSLTVISSSCGPPTYNCSSPSTAATPVVATPTMAAINSTAHAYSAPGDFFYPVGGIGNCYTALSDITSRGNQSIHASWSGGASNNMWDVNRAYGSATDNNGNVIYFHVHYDANGCMQMDSNMSTTSLSGGTGAGFTFARNHAATAYKVDSRSGTTRTQLYQETLTGTSTVVVTRTLLFDYNNCPGVDGTLTTQGGDGNLNVDSADNVFSTTLNWPPATNGQNGAHWVLSWNKSTNSCSTFYTGIVGNTENPSAGNWWAPCVGNCSQHGSNPAPGGLNTTCTQGFGIHGSQGFKDGLYVDISGSCDPTKSANNTSWQIGTGNASTCNASLHDCGGHDAEGYSRSYQVDFTYNWRLDSDMTTFTTILPKNPVGSDYHGSVNWIGAAADTNPMLLETQTDSANISCSGKPYCYELDAIRVNGSIVRFGPSFHTWIAAGDLGPIAVMTQDGYCMIFESDWNNTRGLDAKGNPRKDLFSICNLQ